MRFQPRIKWINGAYILWLLREGRAKTLEDIFNELVQKIPGDPFYYHTHSVNLMISIRSILSNLKNANLVEFNDNQISATPLINNIQHVLNLSLRDLSEAGPDTVLVNPFFAKPQLPEILTDIFVLMPFSDELKPVYEDHIKLAASQLDLKIARADDFFAANVIISDVWNAIYNSRIIIADCTGRNPNVFYEIGIAHTIGKPTILISQNIEDVPFDLRHIRSIVYKYTPRGMTAFNDSLDKALRIELVKLKNQAI